MKGYVTAIYDCAAELAGANSGATRAQIAVAIERDPTLCERPMVFAGDARGSSRDASIWVVDVPAPAAAPRLAVGDHVVVTGTWAIRSPHGEHNTGGLLVYKAIEHAVAAAATELAAPGQALEMEIEIEGETRPPLRKVADPNAHNTSAAHLNACTKAIAARQYDAGIAECQAATTLWEGNHLAWYAWASAHIAKREWIEARAAIGHAFALRPDQPMYQLYYAVARYEVERQQARDDQARKEHKPPDEVAIDPSRLRLDAAREVLVRTTRLAPALWRAHDYLGRIYRDLDDARRAARQFTETIANDQRGASSRGRPDGSWGRRKIYRRPFFTWQDAARSRVQ